MSANNWRECPKCSQGRLKALQQVQAQYGKVSASAYAALLAQAQMKEKNEEKNFEDTLREVWEIGTNDGVFQISYHCSCNVCGFKFEFNHEVNALVVAEKQAGKKS